ncbi:MAG TPA: PAS domain S-box protein [Nitrospira sp.]|nr:PAS domain S-box protein [Nitrospira sp.]
MSKPIAHRYVLAAGAVAVAVVIRFLLDPLFPPGVPFITFFFAVMVTAWYGGVGPALAAAVLSILAADYWFIDPKGTFKITPTYGAVLSLFSLEAVGIAFLSGQLHEAKRRAVVEKTDRQQVLDSISDGFIAFDHDWRCRLVNPRGAEILGRPIEHLPGRLLQDLFPDLIDTPDWELMQDAQRSGIRKSIEIFSATRQRWYEYRLYPSADGLSIFFSDISEQKQAQEALRESEARFRTMANTAPVLIWLSDRTKSRTWVNKPWLRFTGRTMEQELGHGWTDNIHPDDLDRCLDLYGTSFDRKQSFRMEYRLRRHDGEYRWTLDEGVPRHAEGGEFLGYIGCCVDITERKHAEHARTRLAAIVESSDDAIISKDLNGIIASWNRGAERLFGYSSSEAVGQSITMLMPADRKNEETGILERLRRGERIDHYETIRQRKDGVLLNISLTISPLADSQGRIVGAAKIARDITEQKRAEAALLESQERLRAFADQLEHLVEERTHDLAQSRDRLRALAAELNLTEQRERKRLASDLHDHLAQMLVLCRLKLAQAKRFVGPGSSLDIITQTDDVLADALSYTRTMVADLAPPVLHDLGLPAALKWLSDYMKRYDLTVTVELPGHDVRLPEDEAVLLFQSVRELLMNCRKYAGVGEARVALRAEEGRWRIDVRDDGVGFDPAAITAAESTAGSKFGLFSIRERMRALGGSFDIESGPGKGTTATLILPMRRAGEAAETLSVRRDASSVEAQTQEIARPGISEYASRITHHASRQQHPNLIRVLLVDDHGMVRQGLRSMLETYPDVEVIGEASDGEEAVARVEQWQPAVVVMDINMPKMNGIDATAAIKLRHPDVIVIGLSVNAAGETEHAMLKAGAALLLTKEAAVDELHRAIRRSVETARRGSL